jgi:hypothetical protein
MANLVSWTRAILRSPLPATTRHVLLTLAVHCDDLTSIVSPSTMILALETGLSKGRVCKDLRIAAEAGWIIVRKRSDPAIKSTYRLTMPADLNSAGTDPGSTPPLNPGGQEPLTQQQNTRSTPVKRIR